MPVDDMPIDANVDQLQINADDVLQDGNESGETSDPPDDDEGDEGGETKSPDNKEADDDDLSEPSPSVSSFVSGSEEDGVPGTPDQTQLPRPELLDAVGEPHPLQPRTPPLRSPRHAQPPKPPTPDNTSTLTESDSATDLGMTDVAGTATMSMPRTLYLSHPIPPIPVDPTSAVTQSQAMATADDASPHAVYERLTQLLRMLTATSPVGAVP
jgi:hypothetical protein